MSSCFFVFVFHALSPCDASCVSGGQNGHVEETWTGLRDLNWVGGSQSVSAGLSWRYMSIRNLFLLLAIWMILWGLFVCEVDVSILWGFLSVKYLLCVFFDWITRLLNMWDVSKGEQKACIFAPGCWFSVTDWACHYLQEKLTGGWFLTLHRFHTSHLAPTLIWDFWSICISY